MMEIFHLTPLEKDALGLSIRVSLCAVGGSLPLGIFLAWVLARKRFPGKNLLDGLIHLPLVLPPVVMGYLLLVNLGRKGVVGAFLYEKLGISLAFNWKGAAVAAAVMAFPLLVRAVRLSIENVDRGLEDAACTLGAGQFRIFFTITLPLIIPGIITGAILAFARSIGEFGATIVFVSNIRGQTQTLPLALYTLTQSPGGDAAAFRLCLIAVVLAMTALLTSELLARKFASHIQG
jgi:molybdate transport system permease protein